MFIVLANYSGTDSGTAVMAITCDIGRAIEAARAADSKYGYFFYYDGSGVEIHRLVDNHVYPALEKSSQKVFERLQIGGKWEEQWFDPKLQQKFEGKPEPATAS